MRDARDKLLEDKQKLVLENERLNQEKKQQPETTLKSSALDINFTGSVKTDGNHNTAATPATPCKPGVVFGANPQQPHGDALKKHERTVGASVDLSNPFAYNPTSPMLKKDEASQDKTRAKSLSSAAKFSEPSIFNTGAPTPLFGGSSLSEKGKSPGLAGIPTNTFDFTAPSPRHKIDKAQQDKAKDQSTELPTQNPITPRGDWVLSQSFGALSPRAKKGHAPTDKMKETSVNLDDATTVNVPNMGPVPVPKSKLSEKLGKGKKKEDEEEQS